jgi:hypothetical protein
MKGGKVYKSFVYDCQNLEATKMFLSKLTDKLWYSHIVEYYSVRKEHKIASHEIHGKTFKCILLSERSQS